MNVIELNKKLRPELQEVADALQTLDLNLWDPLVVVSRDHAHFKNGVLNFCEDGHRHVGLFIDTHFGVVAAVAQAVAGIDQCFVDPWPSYAGKFGDEAIAYYSRQILLDILGSAKAAWYVTLGRSHD